ncbi:hypothetical protein Dsin_027855 [Dipteronia sinensis]|uniref:Uncharacterized protein n=1 Tax=Dipteronia sinensis TaxID=43782 RepID=A0AAD9ZPY6_9ROSI|nr:hypothetical protein Dsin_027855 [Dipteronia sinensis]
MADNPKLDSASSCEASGFEDNKNNKVSILDHINGFKYNAAKKADSFVIDMDTFSGPNNKDHINANSRNTLQRSLSRKGSQRGGAASAATAAAAAEKKINSNINERDTIVSTSSPRGHGTAPDKQTVAAVVVVGADHSGGERAQGHHHHQITITTGNMISSSAAPPENRSAMKRNSFKRSSSAWVIDPKRVLLFFATLSSIGTILLIYFTLSVGKYRTSDESYLD